MKALNPDGKIRELEHKIRTKIDQFGHKGTKESNGYNYPPLLGTGASFTSRFHTAHQLINSLSIDLLCDSYFSRESRLSKDYAHHEFF